MGDNDVMVLLERSGELERLSALVRQAAAGRGQVALIRGEAGIGKTSLARAFVECEQRRAHVLWGSCDDLLAARPFGPVKDMAASDREIARALDEGDPERVFTAFRDCLQRALRPTIAVFEDVHWADGATLDLVTWLGRRLPGTHGVVVLTFREAEPGGRLLDRLLGDLPSDRVLSLALAPLSAAGVLTLTHDRDRADEIWRLSGGNPFFVTELSRERSGDLPPAVSDLVASQVARLSAKAQQLLALASVVPGGLELTVLEEAARDLGDVVAETVEARLLQLEGQRLVFAHELVRTAVEATLSEPRRRDLHGRILRAVESLGLEVSRLAHHARLAGDVDAMVRLLPAAARQAVRARSHPEAMEHLRALADHLDRFDTRDRASLLELMAAEELIITGGGRDRALEAAALWRDLGDSEGLGRALVAAARSAWSSGDRTDAIRWNLEAVQVLQDLGGEPLAGAYAELSHRMLVERQDDTVVKYADQALSLAPGPSKARATALTVRGFVRWATGDLAGERDFVEAEEIGHSLALEDEWVQARWLRTVFALAEQGVEAARALNAESMAEVAVGTAEWTTYRLVEAMIGIAGGQYDAHEGFVGRQAEEASQEGGVSLEMLTRLSVRRGSADARALLEALDELTSDWWQEWALVAQIWAEFLWAFRLRDDEVTAQTLDIYHDPRLPSLDRLELGLWLWLDGHLDAPEVAPYQRSRPEALLIAGRWREAAAAFHSLGRPYERAVALSRGDSEAGLEAIRIADGIGAEALAARFRAQLRAEGVPGVPRRRPAPPGQGPRRLTARQSEVLELLADSLTNQEIAERLFLSPRTVEKHVAALIVELGAADRWDAVTAAKSAGLLPRPSSETGR